MKKTPSIERLRHRLEYDPETGKITWKTLGGRRGTPGKEAGGHHNAGYRHLCVDNCSMLSHRVAWAMHYGEWPAEGMVIDHINRDRTDNRISNLRVTTYTGNFMNKTPGKRDLPTGVSYDKRRNKYQAKIQLHRKSTFLGYYKTADEAEKAYLEAKDRLWSYE